MIRDNILADKSIDFAIRMAKCYRFLMDEKQEFIMSKQMFRSGTSIGANIHEAIQAQSKSDFLSKLSISLKEASETSYWLVVLHRAGTLDEKFFVSLKQDLDEIIRILISTIKTTKQNITQSPDPNISPNPNIGISPTPNIGISPNPNIGISPTPNIDKSSNPNIDISLK